VTRSIIPKRPGLSQQRHRKRQLLSIPDGILNGWPDLSKLTFPANRRSSRVAASEMEAAPIHLEVAASQ